MTATLQKSFEVAKIAIRISEENDKQYTTSDFEMADLMAKTQTEMVSALTPDRVKHIVKSLKAAYKFSSPTIGVWTYLCMFTNWLSWGWHEVDEPELSKAWADAWYEINDFSLATLKGDELKTYIEVTD